MSQCENCRAGIIPDTYACPCCGKPYQNHFYEIKTTNPYMNFELQLEMYEEFIKEVRHNKIWKRSSDYSSK